ncbi:hypothetical protein TeGR_g15200 [Tetraparma gracilis]|uniref:WD repeat-containing protein 54 beta-propeller domain-containing protein n=1 Tax=Tetraparma gracilis TaxID=2962635 RepID=A0ABQ6MJW9_9STRA|nr:hypothetical protein TeGR_g15200 [Tetraparma gracilis]
MPSPVSSHTYTRKNVVCHPLRQSPSLLHNNLSVHNNTMAYARDRDVYLTTFGSNRLTQLPFRDPVPIFSLEFLPLADGAVLCIGMQDGFQLWAADSFRMVYFHALHPSDTDVCYASSSHALSPTAFLVGDSTGAMHTFEGGGDRGGSSSYKNLTSVRNHQATITSISRGDKIVASGDSFGAVAVYDISPSLATEGLSTNTLTVRRLVNVAQSPVTRLLSSTAFLIAAFADGSVKVLNNELKMRVSINAHARAISSMDIDEMSGVFLTAGEDSTLCVWTVPTGEEGTVDLVMADSVPDRLVTGAKFLTDGYEEKKIVASCYDHDQVIVWNRKEND